MPAARPEVEVDLLRWPREDARRRGLSLEGRAVLLLVERDVGPPTVRPNEDWIRLPADEREVSWRARALRERVGKPVRVSDGMLLARGHAVPLTDQESALLDRLIAAEGNVVSRSDLEGAAWPAGAPHRRSLDDAIFRLRRRRLSTVGLDIVASYRRGFALRILPETMEP